MDRMRKAKGVLVKAKRVRERWMIMLPISVRGVKILTKVTSVQQLKKKKQQAHVVLIGKILPKLS